MCDEIIDKIENCLEYDKNQNCIECMTNFYPKEKECIQVS